MEMIVAAAGSQAGSQPALAPLPPELLAAARDLHEREVPVRLDVAGSEIIAIVNGAGDPREWWNTIVRLATPAGHAS
jgi:hypothetical protein